MQDKFRNAIYEFDSMQVPPLKPVPPSYNLAWPSTDPQSLPSTA